MITTLKEPHKFSPAGNPIVFTLSGSNPNLVLFKIELIEANSDTTIYTGNIFPTPINPNQASINLSKQLSSLVKYDVENIPEISMGKTQPIIAYKLKAVDYGVTGGTLTALSTGFTSDVYYAFDGELDVLNFSSLSADDYIMKGGNAAKFLTLQPNFKEVNEYSNEQLYFLNDSPVGMLAIYTVRNTPYAYYITGVTTTATTTTPAIAGNKATATLTITGSSIAGGDNIGVYANGSLIGAYTAFTSGVSAGNMADQISTSLSGNSGSYSIQHINGSNTIKISAPTVGTAGNSISLTTARTNNSTTGTTITASTSAVAVLSGYTLPSVGSSTIVTIDDPLSGVTYLGFYTVANDDVVLNAYTNNLVDELNLNPHGYVVARTGSGRFSVSARTGTGASMNGRELYYENNVDTLPYTGIFSGGVTSGSGSTVTNHNLIPNSIIQFSGGTNSVASGSTTTVTTDISRLNRLQTSPKVVAANSISTDFNDGEKYSVHIFDYNGEIISEVRHYVYKETPCNVELVNILWVNSFGGVDTYQFVNPQINVLSTKLSIQKNNLKADNADVYSTNGIYNVIDEVYKSSIKSSFKVHTKPLTDEESDWLVDMVNSRQIYVELTDGSLVPVILNTTNYQIQKKKYIGNQLNQYQFDFSFSENFIPSLSSASIIINQ